MPSAEPHQGVHVELQDVSKSFGGTHALEGVSLAIGHGSIHALVGENGAGKSTLGKIIAGVHLPDHGQLLLAGEPVRFRSPRDAISRGVILIAQELATVPSLTVAENVFLGVEPRRAGFQNRRDLRRRYTELAASVGFELDGDSHVGSLRTTDQQKVEIMRALCRQAQLIVMDEPTAALSRADAKALHVVIRQMLAIVIALGVVLSRTIAGRYMYAAGSNAEAARLAGVRVQLIKLTTFVISGGAAALGGIIDASRVLSAQASNGETALTFTVLAGIVVGGTSILGGEGAIWRTVVGTLFIALIGNGFVLLGLNPLYQQITLGGILLIAVGADAWSRLRTS